MSTNGDNKSNFCELTLLMVKSILAGVAISAGGLIFTTIKWAFDKIPKFKQVGDVVGSVLFSGGLLVICSFKLNLYTGKVGLLYEQKITLMFVVQLVMMLILNIAAAVCCGALVHQLIKDNSFVSMIDNISNSKIMNVHELNDYVKTLIQGVFCGACVHSAVRTFNTLNVIVHKVLSLSFWIACFVYSSFQHCIANAYYFGASNGFNRSLFNNGLIIDLVFVIVGNSLGPYFVSLISRTYNVSNSSTSSSTDDETTDESYVYGRNNLCYT